MALRFPIFPGTQYLVSEKESAQLNLIPHNNPTKTQEQLQKYISETLSPFELSHLQPLQAPNTCTTAAGPISGLHLPASDAHQLSFRNEELQNPWYLWLVAFVDILSGVVGLIISFTGKLSNFSFEGFK